MFTPTLRCECAQPASDRLMRKWCIVQEKSKILDYRMKIQDFQRHMSNKSNILDYRYRLIRNFGGWILS